LTINRPSPQQARKNTARCSRPVGPSGGFGGVGAPGQAQCAERQVAQGCHDPWPGPGPDLCFVLLAKGVAEPVPGLDRPLPADIAGQADGAGAVGAGAGDTKRGDRGQWVDGQVADAAPDQPDLAHMWEQEACGAGMTWMVRVVTRPWPRSVSACTMAT